jgi:GTP-binding protein EngB required for normal cell division
VKGLPGRRQGPRDELAERLEALVEAADALRGRAPDEVVQRVDALARKAGGRVALGADRTVVALAGSTGSGKSSLFNAVVGLELAVTGVRRPTTAESMACVWGADGSGALLDWLDVPPGRRVAHESELDPSSHGLAGLVLLDLPDHDSMVASHRAEVDRLVALVDLLVWVVDPQKYADAVLHEQYLRRLSGHGAVVVVVLNQVDRLTEHQRAQCLTDLHRLVERDGLAEVSVLAVSARTGEGLDALTALLRGAVSGRRAVTDRLAADVSALAHDLASSAGLSDGLAAGRPAGAVPAPASGPAEDRLVAAVSDAVGVAGLTGVVRAVQRRRAQDVVGYPLARLARRSRGAAGTQADATALALAVGDSTPVVDARVDLAVREYVDEATAGLPPEWRRRLRAQVDHDSSSWAAALAGEVVAEAAEPVPTPRWWSLPSVLQAVAFTVAGVGLAWLVALLVLGVGAPVAPSAPTVGGLPWPGVLLVVGVAASMLLSLAVATVPSRWGDRAAGRARERMEQRVRAAVERQVSAPVRAEAERRDRAVSALGRAA